MTEAPTSLIGESLIAEMIAAARETPVGAFVEVGVYKGGSAWRLSKLAEEQGRECHLFDTFTGMPYADKDDNHEVGDFADTTSEAVAAAIPYSVIHVGEFPDTLPIDLRKIAFVHADCDQYRSARAVIDRLGPRMVKGGVIWFDDYECTRGVTRAVDESFRDSLIRTRAGRAYVIF
jgi:hypothetical protein